MPTRRGLTVLKASAGFGKTTLLAECCTYEEAEQARDEAEQVRKEAERAREEETAARRTAEARIAELEARLRALEGAPEPPDAP